MTVERRFDPAAPGGPRGLVVFAPVRRGALRQQVDGPDPSEAGEERP